MSDLMADGTGMVTARARHVMCRGEGGVSDHDNWGLAAANIWHDKIGQSTPQSRPPPERAPTGQCAGGGKRDAKDCGRAFCANSG
jgi:hypothetical protein